MLKTIGNKRIKVHPESSFVGYPLINIRSKGKWLSSLLTCAFSRNEHWMHLIFPCLPLSCGWVIVCSTYVMIWYLLHS